MSFKRPLKFCPNHPWTLYYKFFSGTAYDHLSKNSPEITIVGEQNPSRSHLQIQVTYQESSDFTWLWRWLLLGSLKCHLPTEAINEVLTWIMSWISSPTSGPLIVKCSVLPEWNWKGGSVAIKADGTAGSIWCVSCLVNFPVVPRNSAKT